MFQLVNTQSVLGCNFRDFFGLANVDFKRFFSGACGAERRGRLYRMMIRMLTTRQSSTAHTELPKVMGMEC